MEKKTEKRLGIVYTHRKVNILKKSRVCNEVWELMYKLHSMKSKSQPTTPHLLETNLIFLLNKISLLACQRKARETEKETSDLY